MKEYIMHLNEEQLKLLCSAVELQMRIRFGQGSSIVDNLMNISDEDYRARYDIVVPILNSILQGIVCENGFKIKKQFSSTRMDERDMWISLENALNKRNEEVSLGEYGFIKIEEVGTT